MGLLTHFVTDTLGLTKLPPHLPALAYSFLGFLTVHQLIAPYFSARWFPDAYASKSRRSRNNWAIHVVSQVHTIIIVPLALWVIWNEDSERDQDRAFGWDDRAGPVFAIAIGYFLWDTLDAIVNFTDLGFVIHGAACFTIYTMSYRPFVQYYAIRCLLWEASTFFLNIHWFLDKTNRTGSTFQLVNGIMLLLAFFGVRLLYGGSVCLQFFFTLFPVRYQVPLFYTITFGASNFILQGLNWIWFTKMIAALRKRFESPTGETTKLVNASSNADQRSQAAEEGSIHSA